MRHQRLRNILAAGALTGLVLATIIAFSWGSEPAGATSVEQTGTTTPSTMETLRRENEQLRQAVDTLQQREAQYESQIESANQTILELQSAGDEQRAYEDDEYEDEDEHEDDDEWWEEEREEHEEHEEHEEYEEHDDD